MNKTIDDIHKYIEFVESIGYTISFSFLKDIFAPVTHELIQYDFHPHAVCNYLKHNPETAGKCVMNKRKLEDKGVTKAYYGCCYAGVEEFLFPVFYEGELLICIHVSGYRGKLELSRIRMKRLSLVCGDEFVEAYNTLSDTVPHQDEISAFVIPIKYMLIELYRKCVIMRNTKPSLTPYAGLYIEALHYINENYPNPISCETIAKELKYSPSYIRYIFRREGNISVQAKINEIRLNNAKRLLRGGMMSITDIAFAVGFTDSNYFSSFFKKHEKMTPGKYRNTYKNNLRY